MEIRNIGANLHIVDRFFLVSIAIASSLLALIILLRTIHHAFASKFVLALPIGMIVIYLTGKALSILLVWGIMFLSAG
jgi:hypothetical protein